MIELIAGVALYKYCQKKWKKAFPDVTKEEILNELRAKEIENGLLRKEMAGMYSQSWLTAIFLGGLIGWILFFAMCFR